MIIVNIILGLIFIFFGLIAVSAKTDDKGFEIALCATCIGLGFLLILCNFI